MTARAAIDARVGGAREDEIRTAAVQLFRERGYASATMRELARRVGVEAPSLYNHFPSKHDLLADILIGVMQNLVGGVRRAVEEGPSDPTSQLERAIGAYILFHQHSLDAAAISDSERRGLARKESKRLMALRHELGSIFKGIIERGRATGAFDVDDVSIAAISVLSICARLPVWYNPGGRLSLEEISSMFSSFALGAIGARRAKNP